MDKEGFRRVTTEVLREYGFNKKIRNWYFMNMDRVVVHVELCAALEHYSKRDGYGMSISARQAFMERGLIFKEN